jgi:hypothetical protein
MYMIQFFSFLLPVFVCGVLSMVIGSLWYGPLFGKKWMQICNVNFADAQARKKMQQEAMPLYGIQCILTLFQVYVLASYFATRDAGAFVSHALWIWAAFIMPTIAGCSMWTADKTEMKWARFFIQSGYQLVQFIVFAVVLGFML